MVGQASQVRLLEWTWQQVHRRCGTAYRPLGTFFGNLTFFFFFLSFSVTWLPQFLFSPLQFWQLGCHNCFFFFLQQLGCLNSFSLPSLPLNFGNLVTTIGFFPFERFSFGHFINWAVEFGQKEFR